MMKKKISSKKQQKYLQDVWDRWFEEIEQLEPIPAKEPPDEYGKAQEQKIYKVGARTISLNLANFLF